MCGQRSENRPMPVGAQHDPFTNNLAQEQKTYGLSLTGLSFPLRVRLA